MRVMMIPAGLLAVVLLAAAGPAGGDGVPPGRDVQSICLDRRGDTAIQSCRVLPGRLQRRDASDCGCPGGTTMVDVLVCESGTRPPSDTAELRAARLEAASDGSLIGDVYEGQEICVRRRSRH